MTSAEGDLLRAVQRIGVADDTSIAMIADLLGFDVRVGSMPQSGASAAPAVEPDPAPAGSWPAPTKLARQRRRGRWRAAMFDALRAIVVVVIVVASGWIAVNSTITGWRLTLLLVALVVAIGLVIAPWMNRSARRPQRRFALEVDVGSRAPTPRPLVAAPRPGDATSGPPGAPMDLGKTDWAPTPAPILLTPPNRRLAETASLLRTHVDGDIDILAVIALVARGRPVDVLPRREVAVLRRQVDVLYDDGGSLQPFLGDVGELIRSVHGLADPGVRVLRYAGDPHSVKLGERGSMRKLVPYASDPPPRGALVLVVGDLGIARTRAGIRCGPSAWLEFDEWLRRRGCAPLHVVPYPLARCPAKLVGQLAIVQMRDHVTDVPGRRTAGSGR